MSEKIYAWLLRLFPSQFRERYGGEALQLFQDRSREETGPFKRVRLWFDLIADLLISIPRQYLYAKPKLNGPSAPTHFKDIPGFHVLAEDFIRPRFLLLGAVVATFTLGALAVLNGRSSNTLEQPVAGFSLFETSALPPQNANGVATGRNGELKLSAAYRHQVIDGVIKNLTEYYVYPDVAQRMAEALRANEKKGDDNAGTDGNTFAQLLTAQMRAVSHDLHLRLMYSVSKRAQSPSAGPSRAEVERYKDDLKRTHCGFEQAKILPHNTGYLKFNEFPDPAICGDVVKASMKTLRNVDAVIFDLRDNGGGDPHMVAFICSYLFNVRTHLNDIYNRRENATQEFWTSSPISGNKLAATTAYVLTSSRTFSGAEEFSYDLKNLKRATLVGETTAGGAHLVQDRWIDDYFMLGVPFARAINPISKKDWEGTGVEPDVKVSAEDALTTVQKLESHRR